MSKILNKLGKAKFEGNLREVIVKAVDLVGGWSQFVKTGDVVMLKPNFNTADPFPASTDLEFLKTVVELVYEYGAKLVMIGESCTMSMNSRKVMEQLGVFDLLKMEVPPRIYVFEEVDWVTQEVPNGQYLKKVSVPAILNRADKLILLPCLKTHSQAQFTGSLKLSVGFMKPSQRISLHLWKLQKKIAELNQLVQPDLIIMDARKCFIARGPNHGELREPNLILASTDRVDLDVEGIRIIQSFEGNSLSGIDPWEMPQIKKAVELRVEAGG